MKNITVSIMLAVTLLAAGCSPQNQGAKLKKGTAAYQLALDLSEKVPSLDPEQESVLVSTHGFSISAAEVVQALHDNMGRQTEQLKAMDAEQLKGIILQNAERMAERELLLKAAREAGTELAPGDMESALNDQYLRVGGEEQFLGMLSQAGVSMDQVRANIETDLTIQAYLDSHLSEASKVSEEELIRAYEGDKTASVRHILILTQGKTEEEKADAHKAMQGLLDRARKGEDFAELAREFTEDTGSKDTGGLYEDFPRGRMVKPFEDAAFSVPIGEISDIVETQYGYHILQVVDRKKEVRPFEEVRDELESQLRQQKQGTAVQDYLDRLKQDAGFAVHQF